MKLKINDQVTIKVSASFDGKIGKITGISHYIPTAQSDLMIVTFSESISGDGSTSVCVPEGHLAKV